ncbi:hypothetical protein [Myroides odoratus]|uniref:Uncharacterized protein n=1 Tax=Myroides odoratus TaxID=256 RepID=A0A378RN71_MYROD|nr:hypothetical protein [Myroides odoratus]QQU04765.1 hypothetical protein I6I89_05605 [Myroides odoratus]STZ27789.1 Uncharacterised protein [Myroides odoratus]
MTKENLIAMIYDNVNAVIGGGEQLFCMQFPAQPLNQKMYSYDTSSRNSVLTKPYTIAEAEFRLSDQLFDVNTLAASSNGEKLSTNYNTMLNNLIPKLDYLAPFMKDRASMGKWLLEKSSKKDEDGNNLSRIELCKKLYLEYLEAKNNWNKLKDKTFDEYKTKDDLDGYAKWQSSQGLVETEKLNNLYNDVVISGHLHEVLTILGYLNASSIAEELEISKQKIRNSSRLSLDESMIVYPVQFSPNNWFKALTPNVNPQDLTMAVDSIKDIYFDKKRELSRAKSELEQYESIHYSEDEISKLETDINNAKDKLSKAEANIIKQYTQSAFDFAKIVLKAYSLTNGAGLTIEMIKKFGGKESDLPSSQKIIDDISKTQTTQNDLNDAIGNLTALNAKKVQLQSQDYKLKISTLKQRINELEEDLNYYSDLTAATISNDLKYEFKFENAKIEIKKGAEIHPKLKVSYTENNNKNIEFLTSLIENEKVSIKEVKDEKNDKKVIATSYEGKGIALEKVWIERETIVEKLSEEEAELEGLFADVVIKKEVTDSSTDTTKDSSSSSSSTSVNGWFASYKSSSSSSSATSSNNSTFFNSKMEIGFRVAKVSFDRGSWFNPQFFKMSHAFTKLSDIKLSPGLQKKDVLNNTDVFRKYNDDKDYILPAFPVAMVIAKDITIKVSTTKENSSAMNSIVESESSSSGGFLCFSTSRASNSKNASSVAMSGAEGDYFYIKIPGPQILGYYLQMVPSDKEVGKYQPIIKPDGSNEILEALNGFNIEMINNNHPLNVE